MEKIIVQKWDTYEAEISFKNKWESTDVTDSTFVAIVKKEWEDDEDALDIAFVEVEWDKWEFELNWLDTRWDYILYIKSIDWDKKFTIKETPLTIK